MRPRLRVLHTRIKGHRSRDYRVCDVHWLVDEFGLGSQTTVLLYHIVHCVGAVLLD